MVNHQPVFGSHVRKINKARLWHMLLYGWVLDKRVSILVYGWVRIKVILN